MSNDLLIGIVLGIILIFSLTEINVLLKMIQLHFYIKKLKSLYRKLLDGLYQQLKIKHQLFLYYMRIMQLVIYGH